MQYIILFVSEQKGKIHTQYMGLQGMCVCVCVCVCEVDFS